jgi:hypothetical protein
MGNLLDAPSGAVEIRRKLKKNPRLKISRGFERDTKKVRGLRREEPNPLKNIKKIGLLFLRPFSVSSVYELKKTPGLSTGRMMTRPLGNDLLFRAVTGQVASALAGLTSGFGMGPGVPPPLKSPRDRCYRIR